MERVTGIGGIFFKAKDPKRLAAWYERHLGVVLHPAFSGAVFRSGGRAGRDRPGSTVWSIMPRTTSYFRPSRAAFMLNYRVRSLDRMLAQLRRAGARVDARVEETDQGRFGWVMDPEGNRVELWEPAAGQ